MPLRKPRFYHYRDDAFGTTKFKGFSVYFWSDPQKPDQVNYRYTFCSQKDQWSFKIARKELLEKKGEFQVCRVTDFPVEVAKLYQQCYGAIWPDDKLIQQYLGNRFAWLYKYFL